MNDGKTHETYVDKVLAKFKSWNGPFLTIDKLKCALTRENEDRQRTIPRHEIIFQ